MVHNALSEFGDPILSTRQGIMAGVAANLLMLILLSISQPVTGVRFDDAVRALGMTTALAVLGFSFPVLPLIGGVVYLLFGGLGGFLYSICEMRLPNRVGLVAVGISYGFTIWIVNLGLAHLLGSEQGSALVQSWPLLIACLLYGLTLAGVAIYAEHHRASSASHVVPLD